MRINEITSAQDQLELLRTIIDNTWSAIKQQADAQAKQASIKKQTASKGARPIGLKKAPYPTAPKPMPKPVTQPPLKQPSMAPKPSVMGGAPKDVTRNIVSPINNNRSEKEKQELIKITRGEAPWKPL